MIQYTLTKKVDRYILNNGNEVPMIYTVYNSDDMVIHNNTLPAKSTATIDFKEDGHYYIKLEAAGEFFTIPEFAVFYNTLRSFIEEIRTVFCDCSGCGDSSCEDTIAAMTKAISYEHSMYHIYRDMFEAVYHTMPREMQALMNAGLKGECVHGSADYEKLHNQYLINYYLAFFYTDMDNATSDQDKEDIKAFYKWDHTLPCLRRNGIVPGMGSVIAPPTEDTPTSDYRFSIFNDVFNDIFQ